MTKISDRTIEAHAGRSAEPPERQCRVCGRGLTMPVTPEAIAERIREVLSCVTPRPVDSNETDAQRRELTAEWDSSASIYMRVAFGSLAAELDGICASCSEHAGGELDEKR